MSAESTYNVPLTSLTTREAITDVLNQTLLAFDTKDTTLFSSCWASQASSILDLSGFVVTGVQAMIDVCWPAITPLTTQHMMLNSRIHVAEGAEKAFVTANALHQHIKAPEGKEAGQSIQYLAGLVYAVDLVKVEGMWKVQRWVMAMKWAQGDRGILGSAA